jgi:hypothetical protein
MAAMEFEGAHLYEKEQDYIFNLGFRSLLFKSLTILWAGLYARTYVAVGLIDSASMNLCSFARSLALFSH